MKKTLFMASAVAIITAFTFSCGSPDEEEKKDYNGFTINDEYDDSVTICFAIHGDFDICTSSFDDEATTRALTADGKDMTDVWVLDYVGGNTPAAAPSERQYRYGFRHAYAYALHRRPPYILHRLARTVGHALYHRPYTDLCQSPRYVLQGLHADSNTDHGQPKRFAGSCCYEAPRGLY